MGGGGGGGGGCTLSFAPSQSSFSIHIISRISRSLAASKSTARAGRWQFHNYKNNQCMRSQAMQKSNKIIPLSVKERLLSFCC
jgi:hypothetical protein